MMDCISFNNKSRLLFLWKWYQTASGYLNTLQMKKIISGTAVAVCLLLLACQKGAESENNISDLQAAVIEQHNNQDDAEAPIPVQEEQGMQFAKKAGGDVPPVVTSKPIPVVDWDKKIIKTATVKFEVKDFKSYNATVRNKIKQYGGYVSGEDNFLTDHTTETVLAIKVPVMNFDILMNELSDGNSKLIERSVKTDDVTTTFVDTKSRLESKKQMRLKYLEFLKQSKNMTEVLQVQDEINSIQEEIEAAAGKINYLSTQSAYSTIHLSFYQPLNGFVSHDATPLGFFSKVGEAFGAGTAVIKNLILGLITIWPVCLFGIAGYVLYKRNRKKTSSPSATT